MRRGARVDRGGVAAARSGTTAVFAANGFVFASWAARVPDVESRLRLTPGRLSVLLLAISVGAVVGLPMAGRIGHRLGPRATVRIGAVVALPGVALAAATVQARGPFLLVAAGLVLLGFGNGLWDVSQNYQGTIVERALGRSIMPRFHAGFSLGTVTGALVGALVTFLAVPIGLDVGVAALLGLVAVAVGTAAFLPAAATGDEPAAQATRGAWRERRILLVGLVVLAAAFAEGTANDWLALGFVDGHHVRPAAGVVALAVFLAAMTLGRTAGTRLLDSRGRVPVLRVLFGAAVVGCVLVVVGPTWLAYAGAAIWGLGASLGFPVGMSAAADEPQRAALRLGVVSTIGYLAFLGGPPLIGWLGDRVGVLDALLVVAAVLLLALPLVPATREPSVVRPRDTS